MMNQRSGQVRSWKVRSWAGDGWMEKVGQNLKQNMKVDDLTPEPQVRL